MSGPAVAEPTASFERHLPCPQCGSSDNLGLYSDGHAHCFTPGCGYRTEADGAEHVTKEAKDFVPIMGRVGALTARKLEENTCRKFNYRQGRTRTSPAQIASYYNSAGTLVGQHLRLPNKQFRWLGSPKDACLFGQHLWGSGGKRLVITEGELDALSVAQAFNLTWPVVSVPNGAAAAAKDVARNLEWCDSFDEVVICFDNDAPGRKAAVAVAELFPPGKAKIASLPRKDASDMLVAGETEELRKAVLFNAQVYRPDGIVCGDDPRIRDYVVSFVPKADAEYPWEKFSRRVFGQRLGELVLHTAGTGIGKSTICREIGYDLGVRQGRKVGIVALEESVGRTGLLLVSLAANRRLHLTDANISREDRERWYRESVGNGNFYLYDHFGSLASDNLLARIRYMVKGLGCQWIILDHISIVVSGREDDRERQAIDALMTNLRALVEETRCGMHVISHLSRRSDGKAHEEGAEIRLRDLRGSQALAQLPDIVLGYERNQQDAEKSEYIHVRKLKDRYTGETGLSGILKYDKETGRTVEVDEELSVFKDESQGAAQDQGDF